MFQTQKTIKVSKPSLLKGKKNVGGIGEYFVERNLNIKC